MDVVGERGTQRMSLRTEKRTRKETGEEQYALIDALPQFVWIIRPDGSIAYRNRRWHDYVHEMGEQGREDQWFQHWPASIRAS